MQGLCGIVFFFAIIFVYTISFVKDVAEKRLFRYKINYNINGEFQHIYIRHLAECFLK